MPKLLFLITEDWFFCSHFLIRAIAAREAGYEVVVVAREQQHGARIRAAGLRFIPLNIARRNMNPLRELRLIFDIWRIYRREQADIVHQIAIKPILYGSFVAYFLKRPKIVNAPVGMGYVFSSEDRFARLLRPFLRLAYRLLMNPRGSRVIFENHDDLQSFVTQGSVKSTEAALIRGAGVDLKRFNPALCAVQTQQAPIVMLVARMLRDKGVLEFVQAAHMLHAAGIHARFVLVGDPDPENPASMDEATLHAWHGQNGLEYWGRRDDMPHVFAQADIVCLPSYREGLPKVLLEAAACGRALVATDVPGCREVVIEEQTGLLVPARNVQALANALRRLINDPVLRTRLGKQARHLAETEFSDERVIAQTLDLYTELQKPIQ